MQWTQDIATVAPAQEMATLTRQDYSPSGGMAQPARDVILVLGFAAWVVMVEREFSHSEDKLARSLTVHPRVRRLLVADPFRSAPRKLLRATVTRSLTRFPKSTKAAHFAPLRLRRWEPATVRGAERICAAYDRRLQRAAARVGLERPAVICSNPLVAGFGHFSWAGPVTYYGLDDWIADDTRRRWWPVYREAFARVRARRRRVIGVSEAIVSRIDPRGLHAVVPNGIDVAEWEHLPPPPAWFLERPAPRLLYVGSLQSRIDIGQLLGIAVAFPKASITLVGPMLDREHFAPLAAQPNIDIHQRVGRVEVRGLMRGADVALIPHVKSTFTDAMSPLKLYEYLAGGLPVAAVDLPGTRGISDRVSLVPPGGDMTAAVRRALSLGHASEVERMALVEEHSWERRHDVMLELALQSD